MYRGFVTYVLSDGGHLVGVDIEQLTLAVNLLGGLQLLLWFYYCSVALLNGFGQISYFLQRN